MLSKQFDAFLLLEARRLELLKSSSADFDPVRLIKESASASKSSSTSSPKASLSDFNRCLKLETVSSETVFVVPKSFIIVQLKHGISFGGSFYTYTFPSFYEIINLLPYSFSSCGYILLMEGDYELLSN